MSDNENYNVSFLNTTKADEKNSLLDLMNSILNYINKSVVQFYEESDSNSTPKIPDMILMICSNTFANLCFMHLVAKDIKIRMQLFESMNESLGKLNTKIYQALEIHNAEESTRN